MGWWNSGRVKVVRVKVVRVKVVRVKVVRVKVVRVKVRFCVLTISVFIG